MNKELSKEDRKQQLISLMNSDLSKEEIIEKHSFKNKDGYREINISDAMQEYAEQLKKKEAIAFACWIDGKSYECTLHTDDDEKIWQNAYGKGSYTTEQLYELFNQQTENK